MIDQSAGRIVSNTVADDSSTPRGLGPATARFLDRLPALVLALLCLRVAELLAGIRTGAAFTQIAWLAATAIGVDLINLARYLPGLFLYSLPLLLIRSRRGSVLGLGLAWSLLILVQAALVQYFLITRVPLGADLFAYSPHDIRHTIVGGFGLNAAVVLGLTMALVALWFVLVKRGSVQPQLSRSTATIFTVALMVMLVAPVRSDFSSHENEDIRNLRLSKLAYFFDDSLLYLKQSEASSTVDTMSLASQPGSASDVAGFRYLDPKYPFLHTEQTADVLGTHFKINPGPPPNLVFIIVEGLGRSFSGPGASLGSFTPHLDQLAAKSLYWENFLAVQGRTFAVLPSLFGSLPFGDNGFAKLGGRMPAHATLLSVLKGQGYRLKFYYGADLDFDDERTFLQRQGVDVLVGENDFGAEYLLSNSWGYADNELISRTLVGEAGDAQQPFVSVIQTMTTHTPYTFPGQENYAARFEQRLNELGVAEGRKETYRAYRDIYTSILYTDDALGRFFEEAKQNPAYQNTVFIVTGDHRLPEIPTVAWMDRYHVPLIIFSPLLKAPARIKSVSSHFDIAPSLLAFLSHNYGVKTPQAVTWIGSGLDMEPTFRNIHVFPMKQTKTNLVDFVSGTWFINQDKLYTLSDGMKIEPSHDDATMARVQAQFAAFRAANDQFARSLALMPKEVAGQLGVYPGQDSAKPSAPATSSAAMLTVREVHAPEDAQIGKLTIEVVFANTGPSNSEPFVPLVVLQAANGSEVSESYGQLQRLQAGDTVTLKLAVNSLGVSPGHYFLSVMASHPKTGKSLGIGRHHIPIRFRD